MRVTVYSARAFVKTYSGKPFPNVSPSAKTFQSTGPSAHSQTRKPTTRKP